MNQPERKTKVALEDLFQIKRAERPPAEFWPRFEQELRAKQLAAIVDTRPWWRSFSTKKTFVRLCVPLGAAAVVAMTFSSLRVASVKSAPRNASNAVAVLAPTSASDDSLGALPENQVRPASVEVADSSGTQISNEDVGSAPVNNVSLPTFGGSPNSAEQLFATSSYTVKAAGQALAQLVGFGDNTSAQPADARAAVIEPLTQVATPRDNRRARLLAYSVAFDPHAADSSESVRSRERVTRRISDQAIYDSITRLGLSGDRVSIKF
jgi:hypothetical protein